MWTDLCHREAMEVSSQAVQLLQTRATPIHGSADDELLALAAMTNRTALPLSHSEWTAAKKGRRVPGPPVARKTPKGKAPEALMAGTNKILALQPANYTSAMVSASIFTAISSNNLGGLGPDLGKEPEIRISNVAKTPSGDNVDLVITNVSTYTPGQTTNGLQGHFVEISVATASHVSLRFNFINSISGAPVTMSQFQLSLLGLDAGEVLPASQQAITENLEAYHTTPSSSVVAYCMADGRAAFFAKASAGVGSFADLQLLTPAESDSSLALDYRDIASFALTLQVGVNFQGNVFKLGGSSLLHDEEPPIYVALAPKAEPPVVFGSIPPPVANGTPVQADATAAAPIEPTEFVCGNEGHLECPECTRGSTCQCHGQVRMGYGDHWTPWVAVAGSVQCSSEVFGTDPTPDHGKLCMCELGRLQGSRTSGMRWWPPAAVASMFLVVYCLHYGLRFGSALAGCSPGSLERTFEFAVPAACFAPMLCVTFVAVARRAETLGSGIVSVVNTGVVEFLSESTHTGTLPVRSPDFNGYRVMAVTVALCAIAFCAQVAFRVCIEWHAVRKSEEQVQEHVPRLAIKLHSISLATMYCCIAILLVGIVTVRNSEMVSVPLTLGTLCTVILAAVYFGMHFLGTILSTHFGAAVTRLGVLNANFSPMLCTIFLTTEFAAQDAGVLVGDSVRLQFKLCSMLVLAQTALAISTPFLFPSELQLGRKGEDHIVMGRRDCGLLIMNLFRWAVMILLYVCTFKLCGSLWQVGTNPAWLAHVLFYLAGVYFVMYMLLWLVMTFRHLNLCGSLETVKALTMGKDLVAVCPLIAILLAAMWIA